MAVLNFQTVVYVWSDYEPRNVWIWLQSIGGYRQVRRDNADAVTNILALAAQAKGNGRLVDVEIDDSTGLIQYLTLR